MAVIEAEGLFNGERFERVSDAARYAWPYIWVASNRLGRIELNYHKIAGRAFSRFQHVPTEDEFWGWIREFQNAYLLFVYQVNGSYWGQWDCSEKVLPRHKLASDLASPKPDHAAFSAWRDDYIQIKQTRNSSKPIAVNNFTKLTETLPKDRGKTSETLAHGNGNGNGLNTCSSDDEPFISLANLPLDTLDGPINKTSASWGQAEKRRCFTNRFWPAWPRKIAKAAAERAWIKHANSAELANTIVSTVSAQTPLLTKNGLDYCPYPATWLNERRWEDEPEVKVDTDTTPRYVL